MGVSTQDYGRLLVRDPQRIGPHDGLGGSPSEITERDALVAYLQMLGTLVKFRDINPDDLRQ